MKEIELFLMDIAIRKGFFSNYVSRSGANAYVFSVQWMKRDFGAEVF